MFYVDNATMTASAKGRSGEGTTQVSSAGTLAEMFTTSQLNRLAETYLGKTFNKVSRAKMAEKIYPVIEEKLTVKKSRGKKVGDVADVANVADGKEKAMKKSTGPRRYVVNGIDLEKLPEKLAPQCRTLATILSNSAGALGTVNYTKNELLALMSKGGFESPNPWNNLMFYRRALIELGVMTAGMAPKE
jgi:hypothetical protein